MSAQGLIVFVLVLGCALHAVWRLMPAALRHKLGARPAAAGCGSGCDGCGSAAKPAGAAAGAAATADMVKPLVFHPRPPR